MVSYAVTGAARGIGFEFVSQLSTNPENEVFALVRDPSNAKKVQELSKERPNLHVIPADINKPSQLKSAAEAISAITSGSLDVLIQNAVIVDISTTQLTPTTVPIASSFADFSPSFGQSIEANILSITNTANLFLPLIRKGSLKKIIMISSGFADIDFTCTVEIPFHIPYSIIKAAMGILVAKYAIELKSEGIKVLSMAPGWVDTQEKFLSPQWEGMIQYLLGQFRKYKPDLQGMTPPEEAVAQMLKVIDNLSLEQSGKFVSQFGNQQWL